MVKGLSIDNKVKFGTFRHLAKTFFDEQGSLRDGTLKALKNKLADNTPIRPNYVPRVLLIDEVDVLFGEDFYGELFIPSVVLNSPDFVALLEAIYNARGPNLCFEIVTNVAEYTTTANARFA